MRTSTTPFRAALIVLASLVATSATMSAVSAAGAPAGPARGERSSDGLAKVDEQVLADVGRGREATFWVRLRESADLSGAAAIEDWAERGAYVAERLRTTAQRSQAALRAELDASGTEYTDYWVSNALRVRGDESVVLALAEEPTVDAILASVDYAVPDPVDSVQRNAVSAVEWGIARINADDVWNRGVRGEGIVVANIDTGVQFDHPAVVRQYRGNTGAGTFDHNYNWWDPTRICPSQAPCDNHGHGTHTMGTMVGDDGAGNQIGVAPAARWIAIKGCETNVCSDAALLSAAQFVLAPTDLTGGNPRPDLRPHIVNNSWGGAGGNPWFGDIVRAWWASGIFPQFSNGNTGPACGSSSTPGDYPEVYSAGAFNGNGVIAAFSGRGASPFGGVKPDISAPGVNIRSSLPHNSYGLSSGTSMASPHVAGTVALMWSAAPRHVGNLASTINALDATAHDVTDLQCGGTADDNNVWGEGTLDALGAVELVQTVDPVTVTGSVTDGSGHGWPLYARIDVEGQPGPPVFTDPQNGKFHVPLAPHSTYQFTVTPMRPGYLPVTRSVTVTTGNSTQDFTVGVHPACETAGYHPSPAGPARLTESFSAPAAPPGWTVTSRRQGGQWRFDDLAGRGNLTGGSGGFAALDSDNFGMGYSQDSDLGSPPLDLSSAVAPTLTFRSDYRSFPTSTVDVEYSVDGGATWTGLWHHTTEGRRTQIESIPIPAAGEPIVLVRFRYQGTWAWWWQIDDVVVEDACAMVPGGLVVGTVSDSATGAAINGATVAGDAGSTETATTGPTPDDPNVGDGFYTLFSPGPASRRLTARAHGRAPATHSVDVATNSVVRRDFQLAVAPPVRLSIADARTSEPDRATAPLALTVTADPAPASSVTVLVRPTAESARAGADYIALPTQRITFAAGQRTRQVTIPIVGDLLREPTETFTLRLSDPSGAALADSTAVGTIVDNDSCTIVGTAGRDTLRGTPGHDEICGLGGDDVLVGGAGNDTLRGGDGNDVLNGQAGNDRLDGGSGVDLGSWVGAPSVGVDLTSGRAIGWGRDTLIGLENVQGGASGDRITGSARANVLVGGQGNDRVRGAAGNDIVRGGGGNDLLDGQAGNDHVDGGAGNDTCSPSTGRDTRRRCERP